MSEDEELMRRAIDLAERGEGRVAPNPMVGCVITARGRIIGEGWHRLWGEPHAEVNAMRAVGPDDVSLLHEASVFVNLEPCAHYGKTPPCAEMLVRAGVRRVVIANRDPFPEVSGRGIRMLQEAGIEVQTGILETEGRFLNRRFFTLHTLHRPYVILKWAQSNDGFIARRSSTGGWQRTMISNASTRQLSHRLRASEMAILVGRGTVECDDPMLTVRDFHPQDEPLYGPPHNPIRIILDREGTVDAKKKVFHGSMEDSVLVFVHKSAKCTTFANASAFMSRTEWIPIDFDDNVPLQVLDELARRNISSLIVEGGRTTLQQFINAKLWDECRIETNPSLNIFDGLPAPTLPEVKFRTEQRLDGHLLQTGYRVIPDENRERGLF